MLATDTRVDFATAISSRCVFSFFLLFSRGSERADPRAAGIDIIATKDTVLIRMTEYHCLSPPASVSLVERGERMEEMEAGTRM